MFTAKISTLTDAELSADRADWTMPNPHGLDVLPDDACGECRGSGSITLVNTYLCRSCSGTGKRFVAEAA